MGFSLSRFVTLFGLITAMAAALGGEAAAAEETEDPTVHSIRLHDAQGNPVEGVTCVLTTWQLTGEDRFSDGKLTRIGPSNDQGMLLVPLKPGSRNPEGKLSTGSHKYKLFLFSEEMAGKYVWAPNTTPPRALELHPTVEVFLKLEGETVRGKPKIAPLEYSFGALHKKTSGGAYHNLRPLEKGRWSVRLLQGESYVVGWPTRKKVMFGFLSEPFVAREGLTCRFAPGMPAVFEYDMREIQDGILSLPASVFLLKSFTKGERETNLSWGGNREIKKPGVVRIKGIAGGKYQISAQPQKSPAGMHQPFLRDYRDIVIKPGVVNRFKPKFPTIDTTVEAGDVSIEGQIIDSAGKPLKRKLVTLIPQEGELSFDLYYPAQKTDKHGMFKFVGVDPKHDYAVMHKKKDGTYISRYVTKDAFAHSDAVHLVMTDGLKKVSDQPRAKIEDLALRWPDGSEGRLSDFRGKTVVIDVWATWCGPCRRQLPEVNALARRARGLDGLTFLAVNIDAVHESWEGYLEDHPDLDALRHGRLDPKKNSFSFRQPLPYQVIIDKNGAIHAAGNGLDIKTELSKLGLSVPDA